MRLPVSLRLLFASFLQLAAAQPIERAQYCSSCIAAGGLWYTGENSELSPSYFHDQQGAGGQCFSPSQSQHYTSIYKYKVTACRDQTSQGVTSLNDYFDAISAAKCSPNSGQATCSGCTSVSGCDFFSEINYDPGRSALGSCSTAATGTYMYRTPASCESNGAVVQEELNAWLAIIPLLLIVGYIINAVAVCIVAKKRGNNPCAWFFVALMFNVWSWICLLACTSKQPSPSAVVPISASTNSTAFVPPLLPYGHGYPYPNPSQYNSNPNPAQYNSHSPPYAPGSLDWHHSNTHIPNFHQQQPTLLPHTTAYVASPPISTLPPNPYGAPVYTAKPL